MTTAQLIASWRRTVIALRAGEENSSSNLERLMYRAEARQVENCADELLLTSWSAMASAGETIDYDELQAASNRTGIPVAEVPA